MTFTGRAGFAGINSPTGSELSCLMSLSLLLWSRENKETLPYHTEYKYHIWYSAGKYVRENCKSLKVGKMDDEEDDTDDRHDDRYDDNR